MSVFDGRRLYQEEMEAGRPEEAQRYVIYGVGTALLSNCTQCGTNYGFTADVVRVKLDGRWVEMAKVGRQPGSNPLLEPVT